LPGPHRGRAPSAQSSPGTSGSGRPGPQSITTSTDRGRHRFSPAHGRPDAGKHGPDDLRSHAADGVHSARTLFLDDGRSWHPTGVSLADQAVEPGPLPERLPRRRPGPARCRCWPSTARAGSAARRGLGQLPEPFADMAGWPDPGPSWPCGRPPRRRAPRVTRCGHADTDAERADTDAGRRTSTPGHWTPGRPDIGHRTRGHRTRGYWTLTPDTGHRTLGR
jgi:hypothetical protein